MGVNLKPLTSPEAISLGDLKGKIIAIDAYNALHQFLSIIRQRDGTPLKDASGGVTSHLTGLLYRTANLVERGIKPIYVFDGKPHHLKIDTLRGRKAVKEKAMEDWERARKIGDMEEARKKAQQTSVLSREMVDEAKKLLEGLGIPYVQAPGEGEAQASFMSMRGDADAVSSQDFDCLLFGAPVLVRNVAITGKRKMPGRQKWVDISPERISLEMVLAEYDMTREQLVDVAILIGTDFNKGVKGIGPKTALKFIKKYGNIEEVLRAEGITGLDNVEEVRDIFLNPSVTDGYSVEWRAVDVGGVMDFLCGEHQFGKERVIHAVEKFKAFSKSLGQRNLFDF